MNKFFIKCFITVGTWKSMKRQTKKMEMRIQIFLFYNAINKLVGITKKEKKKKENF